MKRILAILIFLAIVAGIHSQSITTTYSYSWKYDTTFNSQSGTKDYAYTGAVQMFDATPGTYTLQVWGAQGGQGCNSQSGSPDLTGTPGKGGYAIGTLTLAVHDTLYIYVGGRGGDAQYSSGGTAGFNGGGLGYQGAGSRTGGGGGATDMRLVSGTWNNNSGLLSRIIVAGGGGSTVWTNSLTAGYGGGTTGGAGNYYSSGTPGTGGTQYSGGSGGASGSFGTGANSYYSSYNPGGAGGGGWYGGGSGSSESSGNCAAGGGGSGYVYTSSTASNYPAGCLLNSSYYLTSASTSGGNVSFASTSGGTETGHSGDGYARITYSFKIVDHIDSSIIHTYVTTTIIDSVCKNGVYNKFGFTVNGNSLSSGVHTFTHQNPTSGKDSTTILQLTIKPDATTFVEIDAPDSYFWSINGQTYTESGIYTYETVTLDGCDSTVVLALTIYDPTIDVDEYVDYQNITISPNPAHDYIDIANKNVADIVAYIYNMYGQKCIGQKITGETARISLEMLPAGTYLLRLCGKNGFSKTEKIVVLK